MSGSTGKRPLARPTKNELEGEPWSPSMRDAFEASIGEGACEAVLHVDMTTWTTLLERSWVAFERRLNKGVTFNRPKGCQAYSTRQPIRGFQDKDDEDEDMVRNPNAEDFQQKEK